VARGADTRYLNRKKKYKGDDSEGGENALKALFEEGGGIGIIFDFRREGEKEGDLSSNPRLETLVLQTNGLGERRRFGANR